MGKHTRRNNRKQNKGNNKNKGGRGEANINDNSSKNPTVVRIRHGDARVRHGALVGLSSTVFSPDVLSNTQKGCTDELIKALGERVMHDTDVPCAVVAAGCLSNYITFANADAGGSSGSVVKIGPILLARIDRCCADVTVLYGQLDEVEAAAAAAAATPMEGDGSKTNKQPQKVKQSRKVKAAKSKNPNISRDKIILSLEEQWTLACVCLRALCGLVERGSRDDDDLLASTLSANDTKFISTLMLVIVSVEDALKRPALVISSSQLQPGSENASNENSNDQDIVKKGASEASTISLRALHAALDDDLPLLRCLLNQHKHVIPALVKCIQSDTMAPLSRLHASGCLVVIRQSLPLLLASSDVDSGAATAVLDEIQTACVQAVLPLLNQTLTFDTNATSPLILKLCEAAKAAAEEAEDEKLERDAVRSIKEKREPARLIARRQKLVKQEKDRKKAEEKKLMNEAAAAKMENSMEDTDIVTMEDELLNNMDDENKMDTDEKDKREDKREAYENACNEWTSYCLPLKLGLEVTTNLCSSTSSNQFDEDDEMMMADAHEMEEEECHPLDKELRKTIANAALIDRVLGLIAMLRSTLPASEVPELVLEDISELFSKVAACLGNAFGNLPEWRESTTDMGKVWAELRGIVVALSSQKTVDAQEQALQEMANAAACNSMAAILRSRPVVRSSLGDDDLSLILGLVNNSGANNGSTKSDTDIVEGTWKTDSQRDAVAMLGVLCSEPHSDAVNDHICSALLSVLERLSTTSGGDLAVINEAFDVLMDMYGLEDDDPNSHSGVFQSKNVLKHFEASIPLFEGKIKNMADEQKGKKSIVTEEDLDVWRETALNASRFVEYKKGNS